ncbi:MAG: PAS domain S-box protein [Burkholderiales bacterium]|nr:MAG: PAS domain S-box protein [Burkholderiales bacterium]
MPSSALQSDRGFGTLFDFLPIGAYRCAPDGTMLHANPSLVRLNGFDSEAEFLANVNRMAGGWYVEPGRRRDFQQQLASHGHVRGFISAVRQHGSDRQMWVSENAHMVRAADGSPLYYEGTVEDITERVEAQLALQRSEEQFRRITSQIPGMVYVVYLRSDGSRAYRYVSEGVQEIYGVSVDELLSDPMLVDRCRHPDDVANLQRDIQRIAREGQSLDGQFRIVRPDGQVRWIYRRASIVGREPEGALCVGVQMDVTERVEAQLAQRRSEDQLRQITAQIPGMVYVTRVAPDGSREYLFVSEGVREIYGFAPEDLMRDPMLIARYRHPEDARQLQSDISAVLETGSELAGEFRIVLPDGRMRWVYRRSCEVGRDESGVVRVGVLLNVTERVEAQQALHASEALWKVALESAGDGVWDWNLVTGEEYFSPGILAMYGFGEDELNHQAQDMDRLTHPDDIERMLADRKAHFDGRTPVYRNEHRIRCKDGRWKWVLSRGMVIARDEDGRPLRMVGTHTDISDLKLAEARRQALEVQLRESQKMEAIGTLAGGVAHDFNNLLAAILGNLALAREDLDAGHPAQESLTETHRAAIRARQLVQQILTFSRRQEQELVPLALTPVIEEGLGLLRSLLPAGVRLHVNLASGLEVMADATQMQQVLMNLCTNAWQSFAGRGGEISVSLRRRELDADEAAALGTLEPGWHACLSVADDGPGMDADTRRRIFEPFFTTKAPGEGTGLGLSVVHGIVQGHRGTIGVRSHPGAGTRFDIWLPLLAREPAPVPASAAPASGRAAAEAGAGLHIVYVDDYEALVFLVGRLLRKQGYRVSTFDSGEAALAWLQQNPNEAVDLLVTDQNMPGMSGVDLCRETLRERPGLRVAIVSGHVNDQLLAEAGTVGVHQVLAKQDSMDALGKAIGQLVEDRFAPR